MSNEEPIWKTVIIHGQPIEDYFVSNDGIVKRWCNKKNIWKYPKLQNRVWKERGNRQDVSIRGKNYHVHRIVAEAFLPLDLHPPVPVEDWNNTPDSVKELLMATLLVDHIDDNPFNNCASNLRWVTPRQNNRHNKLMVDIGRQQEKK